MIIKFGVVVVGARGTAGGLTFSANGSGPYAKAWSRGANQRSSAQSDQRGTLTSFAKDWADLSQAQRDDWDDYADDPAQELTDSLGVDYFISGFNWYVRINLHLTTAAAAARDDAPTLTRPAAPIIQTAFLYVTGHASNTAVQYTVADPDLTALHGVFSRVVNSQGISHIPGRMPFIRIAVPNVNRSVITETEIEAAFGIISLGQRMLVDTYIQDAHGQRGPTDTIAVDAIDP